MKPTDKPKGLADQVRDLLAFDQRHSKNIYLGLMRHQHNRDMWGPDVFCTEVARAERGRTEKLDSLFIELVQSLAEADKMLMGKKLTIDFLIETHSGTRAVLAKLQAACGGGE